MDQMDIARKVKAGEKLNMWVLTYRVPLNKDGIPVELQREFVHKATKELDSPAKIFELSQEVGEQNSKAKIYGIHNKEDYILLQYIQQPGTEIFNFTPKKSRTIWNRIKNFFNNLITRNK